MCVHIHNTHANSVNNTNHSCSISSDTKSDGLQLKGKMLKLGILRLWKETSAAFSHDLFFLSETCFASYVPSGERSSSTTRSISNTPVPLKTSSLNKPEDSLCACKPGLAPQLDHKHIFFALLQPMAYPGCT